MYSMNFEFGGPANFFEHFSYLRLRFRMVIFFDWSDILEIEFVTIIEYYRSVSNSVKCLMQPVKGTSS